ncbi:MAG: hypothetical protein AAF501_08020 [Pseudomonadota bacterium]
MPDGGARLGTPRVTGLPAAGDVVGDRTCVRGHVTCLTSAHLHPLAGVVTGGRG